MLRAGLVTAGVVSMLFAGTAVASEQVGEWYAAGLAVYIDPASDRDLDNDLAGAQLSIGKAWSENLNFEAEVDYLEIDGDGGDGADFTGLALNAMYLWNRDARFTPYLLGGIGAVNIDPNRDSSDTKFQAQAGPGFLLDLWNDRWALRAEALGRYADSETDLLVNFGLQYAFGGDKQSPVAAAAAPLDSDGDGVPDDIDQCPNTPPGMAVDEVGCPLDSDGDGVTDDKDLCPETPLGTAVDSTGCAIQYTLSGVAFGLDSAELSDDGKKSLDTVADRMNSQPDISITIEGHTDSLGAAEYNKALSKRRANSVKSYLEGQGIAAERLTAVGKGEEDPLASNDTEEGRAANRRVVLSVDES